MAIKTLLIIRADTNDADYVTAETDISVPKMEQKVRAVLGVLGPLLKASSGAWPRMDWDSPDKLAKTYPTVNTADLEYLTGLCPCGESGIHSIESIRIIKIESEENFL